LVNPYLEELAVAHNVKAHGRSGHHSGCGWLEHHHADLPKEVVWAQAASVDATHEHVHLAVREQVEGMVPHFLRDDRGAARNPNFGHRVGEKFQVDAGEAREERYLSEVVDFDRHPILPSYGVHRTMRRATDKRWGRVAAPLRRSVERPSMRPARSWPCEEDA